MQRSADKAYGIMAKFSIIVPIYNVEQYLERCIRSLQRQTLREIEIILVDDGSPDGSPAICDRYAAEDPRIRVIHKENGGVSAARNDGLAAASGEWVIFCDSDDWMEPDALRILYETGMREGVDVVVADIHRIKGSELIYNKFFSKEFVYTDENGRKELDDLVRADIFQNYCPLPPDTDTIGYGGPWNKGVRRAFLLEHGITFDESLGGLFDDILYTAYVYANMKSIAYVQKPVYNYVVVSTSITKSYKANSLEISEKIFAAFEAFIAEYGADGKWDRAYDALVVRRLEECMRLYFFNLQNEKSRGEIRREVKETLKKEPYASAVKHVEREKLLPHQAKLALLAAMRLPVGVCALYRLKGLRAKIKGR